MCIQHPRSRPAAPSSTLVLQLSLRPNQPSTGLLHSVVGRIPQTRGLQGSLPARLPFGPASCRHLLPRTRRNSSRMLEGSKPAPEQAASLRVAVLGAGGFVHDAWVPALKAAAADGQLTVAACWSRSSDSCWALLPELQGKRTSSAAADAPCNFPTACPLLPAPGAPDRAITHGA